MYKKERTEEELRNWKGAVAEYQIKGRKRFLKIGGEFQEVELWKTPKWWKVKVVEAKLI